MQVGNIVGRKIQETVRCHMQVLAASPLYNWAQPVQQMEPHSFPRERLLGKGRGKAEDRVADKGWQINGTSPAGGVGRRVGRERGRGYGGNQRRAREDSGGGKMRWPHKSFWVFCLFICNVHNTEFIFCQKIVTKLKNGCQTSSTNASGCLTFCTVVEDI